MKKIRDTLVKIMKRLMDTRMSLKFSLLYVAGTSLFLSVALLGYTKVNRMEQIDNNQKLVRQSTETVKSAVNSMINTIQYNSKVILPSVDIQNMLRENNVSAMEAREILYKNNTAWMTSLPFVESLYLFDLDGQSYGIDKKYYKTSSLKRIQDAVWYKDVMEKEGYYILRYNGDYFLKKQEDNNSVSFLRVVNDINTFEPLGILMININEQAFRDCYKELEKDTELSFFITDHKGRVISSNSTLKYRDVKKSIAEDSVFRQEHVSYVSAAASIEDLGWKITAIIPVGEITITSKFIRSYFVLIVLFIFSVFLFSFYLIFAYITYPIEKMAKTMNDQTGNLHKMEMKVPKGELTILKDTYNQMVERNSYLIQKIHEEQKFKRKAELRVLQEQIKPHFLYNTINAMQYLAATNQNEALYDALEAFGAFYRMSLSKGQEVIRIRDEIEIVDDYIKLQKLRYGEEIQCEINVEENVKNVRILKLILQPLVENSIYHGIKPKMEPGTIAVDISEQGRYLVLSVADNGLGMKEDELNRIKKFSLEMNKDSFGLRGTIERIKNYYENDFVYQVESIYGEGTKITLKIPMA